MGAPAVPLRDGHIHRRFSVVDRALRDQIERTAFGRVVAEVDLEIMIAGYALILAAAKAIESLSVERADDIGDVLAVVIDGASNLVRRGNGGDAKFGGRNHEALIDKDLRALRMIHRHQRQVVVIVDFP